MPPREVPRRTDPVSRPRHHSALGARHALDPRREDRHDLPGADDQPEIRSTRSATRSSKPCGFTRTPRVSRHGPLPRRRWPMSALPTRASVCTPTRTSCRAACGNGDDRDGAGVQARPGSSPTSPPRRWTSPSRHRSWNCSQAAEDHGQEHPAHHARPRRGRRERRHGVRHVRLANRRGQHRRGRVRSPDPSVHAGPAPLDATLGGKRTRLETIPGNVPKPGEFPTGLQVPPLAARTPGHSPPNSTRRSSRPESPAGRPWLGGPDPFRPPPPRRARDHRNNRQRRAGPGGQTLRRDEPAPRNCCPDTGWPATRCRATTRRRPPSPTCPASGQLRSTHWHRRGAHRAHSRTTLIGIERQGRCAMSPAQATPTLGTVYSTGQKPLVEVLNLKTYFPIRRGPARRRGGTREGRR